MNLVETLKAGLLERWGERPVTQLCLRIVDFLFAVPDGQLEMLTLTSLKNAAGKPEVDAELIAALSLLVSTTEHLLDSKLVLVDDDEQEHDIGKEEYAEARASGSLIHPDTGRAVQNFEGKIFPYFVASSRLRQLKGEGFERNGVP